jgi:hypothetical protein
MSNAQHKAKSCNTFLLLHDGFGSAKYVPWLLLQEYDKHLFVENAQFLAHVAVFMWLLYYDSPNSR